MWEGLLEIVSTTLLTTKKVFLLISPCLSLFFKKTLLFRKGGGGWWWWWWWCSPVNYYTKPRPSQLSPTLLDQQKSLKGKPQNVFPSFCRSVVLDYLFFPPLLLFSTHTHFYNQFNSESDTHTHTHQQINSLSLTSSQSWFSVCVLGEVGGRG